MIFLAVECVAEVGVFFLVHFYVFDFHGELDIWLSVVAMIQKFIEFIRSIFTYNERASMYHYQVVGFEHRDSIAP